MRCTPQPPDHRCRLGHRRGRCGALFAERGQCMRACPRPVDAPQDLDRLVGPGVVTVVGDVSTRADGMALVRAVVQKAQGRLNCPVARAVATVKPFRFLRLARLSGVCTPFSGLRQTKSGNSPTETR